MRETLAQAAQKLLTQPVGSEHEITININDGLTGLPPGGLSRDARNRTTKVRIEQQTRKDGKVRLAAIAQAKGTALATSTWR